MITKSMFPELNDEDEGPDREKNPKNDPKAVTNMDNLVYNKDENSFEFDVNSEDPEYDHPDPYTTAAKNGTDFDSDYDEANPTIVDEYDRLNDPATNPEDFGMHVDSGQIVELSLIDEELSKTPEDDRDDLDEEGYPKNDVDKGDNIK